MAALRGVRRRIGHRGAALLIFALIDFIYGTILVSAREPAEGSGLSYIAQNWPPLHVWGWLWVAAGVTCMLSAFLERDTAGFVAAMAIKFSWVSAYVWAFVDGAGVWALAGAAVWTLAIGFVGIVATWPEPPPRGP